MTYIPEDPEHKTDLSNKLDRLENIENLLTKMMYMFANAYEIPIPEDEDLTDDDN